MKLLKTNERGRSMIEMLGVLAIVGILSVGGIAGFSKAMMKHKIIKATEQYNMVFDLIVTDMDKWRGIKVGGSYYRLSGLWKKLGVIPESMIKDQTSEFLYDVFGNKFEVRRNAASLELGIWMNSGGNGTFSRNTESEEICQAIFLNTITLRSEDIKYVSLYSGVGGEGGDGTSKYLFYGNNDCAGAKRCIRDMTMSDIVSMCAECDDDKLCRIIVLLPLY